MAPLSFTLFSWRTNSSWFALISNSFALWHQSNHACSKQSLLALTSSSLIESTPTTGCGRLVGLESSWRRSTQGSATLLLHCNDRLNRRAPKNCSARDKHQWRALLESRLQKKTCHQARIAEVLYKLKSATNELQLQMDWEIPTPFNCFPHSPSSLLEILHME